MATGSWQVAGSGAWNVNANWSGAAFPNAATDDATIAQAISADATITMGQALTVNDLAFSDGGALGDAWIIAPGGAFALTLASSIITTTTNATISASISGTTAITKVGAATLTLTGGGANSGTWAVNEGAVVISTTSFSAGGTITVASGASLTTNAVISKPVTLLSGSTGVFNTSLSGILTVNAGATATISGSTATSSVFNGTGVTFTTATATSTSPSIGTVAGDTVITLPTGRTITGGASQIVVAQTAGAQVALYATGGSLIFGSSGNALNLANINSNTAYLYYLGEGGQLGNSLGAGTFIGGNTTTAGAIVSIDLNGTTLNNSPYSFGSSSLNDYTFNILSGSHTITTLTLGNTLSAGVGNRQQTLTVSGATLASTILTMSATATGASAGTSINIIGGSASFTTGTMTGGTNKRINLNSGTLTFTGAFTGGRVYLYGAGNVLNGSNAIDSAISDPVADTITSIEYAADGTGYIGAPVVSITGGGGTGATARAVFNKTTGVVSKTLVITNPGTGYTGDPTVTLTGGGTSAVAPSGTLTIGRAAPTLSTTFSKTNAGTMTLTGTNTFTGKLLVTLSGGVVRIGAASTAGTLGAVVAGVDTSAVDLVSGASLQFGRSDARTYSGIISGAGTIAVNGGGRATLTGVNTFTAAAAAIALSTQGSALQLTSNDSIGQSATTGITVPSLTALELNPTTGNLDGLPAKALSIGGGGAGAAGTVTGALRSITGTNIYSGAVTLSAAARINTDAGSLTLTSATSITGASFGLTIGGSGNTEIQQAIATTTGTLTKDGTGSARLSSAASSYTGVSTLNNGTLDVVLLRNVGAGNSSLGAPTTIANGTVPVATGTTLKYSGRYTSTTDRVLNFSGSAGTVTLEASGTGSVRYSGTWTTASGTARTLALAGTSGATSFNVYATSIVNPTSSVGSLTKSGTGRWILTGNNTHTGNTTVTAGTLMAVPVATTTKTFGDNTTVVSGGGRIQTCSDNGQKGIQYYKNLTLGTGGKLRIGGSSVNPVILMNGNLTVPGGGMTWDVSADVFKTPGTYRLVEFLSGGLTGGLISSITPIPASGRSATLAYDTGVTPNVITVTIS